MCSSTADGSKSQLLKVLTGLEAKFPDPLWVQVGSDGGGGQITSSGPDLLYWAAWDTYADYFACGQICTMSYNIKLPTRYTHTRRRKKIKKSRVLDRNRTTFLSQSHATLCSAICNHSFCNDSKVSVAFARVLIFAQTLNTDTSLVERQNVGFYFTGGTDSNKT